MNKEPENIADSCSRISEFTEKSWGYRLIRGTYRLEKENQRLLTSFPTNHLENELNKDFEEYG